MVDIQYGGQRMDSAPAPKPNYAPEIVVGIGYVLFLATLCSTLAGMSMALSSRRIPAPSYPTPITPTAHVSVTPAANKPKIFLEDFSKASEHPGSAWQNSDWRESKFAHVRDGKLVIEINGEDQYAYQTCSTCLSTLLPYYMQADFTTDQAMDGLYGLVIKFRASAEDYYLYELSPEAHWYGLFHHGADGWSRRAGGISKTIGSYPAVNTLGVYASGATLQLYVNGTMVDTYEETGAAFERGTIGFYAEGTDFDLLLDNLIIDRDGGA
jgi:hypothetical protein